MPKPGRIRYRARRRERIGSKGEFEVKVRPSESKGRRIISINLGGIKKEIIVPNEYCNDTKKFIVEVLQKFKIEPSKNPNVQNAEQLRELVYYLTTYTGTGKEVGPKGGIKY